MNHEYLAYIGTYTEGESEGIYTYRLDMATGGLEYVSTTPGIDNPTFLDIAPSGKHLYAVGRDSEGEEEGLV